MGQLIRTIAPPFDGQTDALLSTFRPVADLQDNRPPMLPCCRLPRARSVHAYAVEHSADSLRAGGPGWWHHLRLRPNLLRHDGPGVRRGSACVSHDSGSLSSKMGRMATHRAAWWRCPVFTAARSHPRLLRPAAPLTPRISAASLSTVTRSRPLFIAPSTHGRSERFRLVWCSPEGFRPGRLSSHQTPSLGSHFPRDFLRTALRSPSRVRHPLPSSDSPSVSPCADSSEALG